MDNKTFQIRARGIIVHNNNLLTVAHVGQAEYQVLPGGHLEWGEDIKVCLERELKEELGVEAVVGRLLYIHNFVTDKHNIQTIEFLFLIDNPEAFLTLGTEATHAFEIANVNWLARDAVVNFRPQAVFEDFEKGTWPINEPKIISDLS